MARQPLKSGRTLFALLKRLSDGIQSQWEEMGGAAVTEDDQRERIAEDATAHAARDTRCSKADIASCLTVLAKLPGP